MILINQFNIKLRFVEVTDADFIIKLRTDSSKSRFISKTEIDIEKQKLWIKEYKNREVLGQEFYFIAIDENNLEFATYRIYNRNLNSIEIGSFISRPSYDNPINVIKVDVIVKSYVFEELGFDLLRFEVRKENKTVLNYHKKFKPKLILEDELNCYFLLDKETFLTEKVKFEKLFNY